MKITHDELLARIDNVTYAHDKSHTIDKDRIVKQLNGLRSVVELHKPRTESNYCAKCRNAGGKLVPYPCPTIQAIEKELR